MTSFRFHTNFTNPLTITHLATSPTKSNYPKLLLIPQHQQAGIPAAGASAPQSPMLLFWSLSNPKLPLVLRLSARAWPTRAEGKQAGFTPLFPPGEEQSTDRGKLTEYPTSSGKNHWETTCQDPQKQLLPLMLGKSSNSHFQNLPSKHPTARNSQQCCDT